MVRFGCGPLPAGVVLAGILSQVLATRPSVELVVRVDGAEPLLGELDEGRLDFVLMVRGRIDADNRDVSLTPIGPVRIAALARVGHPLAGRRCSSADLAAYPVIGGTLLPAEHERTRFVHQLVCDDYCALRAVTKATDAVWLAADCLADADLVELDCPDFGGEAQLVAAAKSGRTLSAAALAALAAARSTLAQVRRRPGAGPASQE